MTCDLFISISCLQYLHTVHVHNIVNSLLLRPIHLYNNKYVVLITVAHVPVQLGQVLHVGVRNYV